MKILSFDTSGAHCLIAASVNDHVVSGALVAKQNSHLASLTPLISKVLDEAGFDYCDLNWILATKGPGSFTGIRIGLATAQAICICTKASLATVSTFDLWEYALRSQFKGEVEASIVALSAYANQVYVKIFNYKSALQEEPALIQASQFEAYASKLAGKRVICGGTGVHLLLAQMPQFLVLPRIVGISKLGEFAFDAIQSSKISPSPEPMYIQPPSTG
jgi:tRNA threonylcarbamoyladenosine biosynthesis protein TsaB